MHAYQSWMHRLHKTVTHSPFYSYKWKLGWNWSCFDTTLPPLIMLFLFKQFFYNNFYKKMKEVCIKTRATSASRTSEARVLSPQSCKMIYSEFRQKSRYLLCRIIVIREDWSRKTTKNKTVLRFRCWKLPEGAQSLFSIGKLWRNKFFGRVYLSLRACLHGGGGPQIGEVTCGGSPHLSCKRDQVKMRDYMDRRVTSST